MVTNNKVLTVSYGTFSCTLEGFEESFDTMKAIAEYFRDLAADDRYFGAEPPTPDAEMLARIAEKEIARRVSARMDQGTIVLSTAAAQNAEQVPAPAAAAQAAAQPAPAPAAQPVAETPAAPVAAPVAHPAAQAPEAPVVETPVETAAPVAAEPVVETPGVAEEAPVEQAPESEANAAVEADTAAATTVEEIAEEEAPAEDVLSDTTAPSVTDSVLAAIADDTLEDAPMADEVDYIEDAIEDSGEDAPIDLGAIAAVVNAEEAPEEEVAEEIEVEAAEATETFDIEEDTSAPLILDNAIEEDNSDPFAEEASDQADDADWEDEDDTADSAAYEENSIAAKLERIRAVVSRADSSKVDAAPQDADSSELSEREDDDLAAELNIFDDADDAPVSEPEIVAEEGVEDVAEDIVEEVEASAEEPEQAEEDAQPLRARLVRMKKADFEEAVAAGLLEAEPVDDDEDDALEALLGADDNASSLTPEDEADLMSELAKVQAELNQPEQVEMEKAAPAEENLFVEDTPEDDAPAAAERQPQPEPDLSRLMAKADSEMQEPAGKGRRSAIAHLRAAVAATRAEKNAGATESKDGTTAYRSDLASVVRAATGGKKSSAAPLKLVAAQRVDTPAETPETSAQSEDTTPKKAPRRIPVRPRRVSADQLDRDEAARSAATVSASASALSGFLDYAKTVGATQLPESVEAAAAYLSYVENVSRFTRPMLMRMAREVNIPQFTREEGLRSFGQLLRDKKIEKVSGGRFTATSAINFQPRDREAG